MTFTKDELKKTKDFCRITGCNPIKGIKTHSTPRTFLKSRENYLVQDGNVIDTTRYREVNRVYKNTLYSKVIRIKKEQ